MLNAQKKTAQSTILTPSPKSLPQSQLAKKRQKRKQHLKEESRVRFLVQHYAQKGHLLLDENFVVIAELNVLANQAVVICNKDVTVTFIGNHLV